MGLSLGPSELEKIWYGSTLVTKAWLGSELVYGSTGTPTDGTVLISDTFDRTGSWSSGDIATGGGHPTFYLENGGLSVTEGAGVFANSNQNNFRMWTQQAVGGPGQNLSIKYRIRANSITNVAGGIVEGVKCLIKWVAPIHSGPVGPDGSALSNPQNARGIYPWWNNPPNNTINQSTGSMTYVPMTANGYQEISKRPWGAGTNDYVFPVNRSNGTYALGTWLDLEITLEWLSNPNAVRMRCYRNGALDFEWTDTAASGTATSAGGEAFMWKCFPGIRADDAAFELDSFSVTALTPNVSLYSQSFTVDAASWTLEQANATNLRRDTARDAGGALAVDAIAAGNIRAKSPHFTASAGQTVNVTWNISHDDTAGRVFDPQIYETTSTGSYLAVQSGAGVTIPTGTTPTAVTRTYTLNNASTAAMRVVPQLLAASAAGTTLFVHDVNVTATAA